MYGNFLGGIMWLAWINLRPSPNYWACCLISVSERTVNPCCFRVSSACSKSLTRRTRANLPFRWTADEYAYSMFSPMSPKILVILDTFSFSVIRITVTSMFFLAFAKLKSASSRTFVALVGFPVIRRTKPNSPASAIDRANIFILFLSSFSITSDNEPGWLSRKTLTCCIGI